METVNNWGFGKYRNSVTHRVIISFLIVHKRHLLRMVCYLFTEEQFPTHKHLLPFGMFKGTSDIHVELPPDRYVISGGQADCTGGT